MTLVFLLGLLASSIIERRAEAQFVYTPVVEYDENEPRNEIWGENFPREYQSYKQTSDTSYRSLYNGNALRDALEEDPFMVILWAGYAFSKDYNQPRGHYYAIDDIRNTLRTGAPTDSVPGPQPNTCWTCKSPDVPRVMNLVGIAEFYKGKWETRGSEIVNYIGCADCHDAKTMNLRISRPSLIEAYQMMGKDINQASHQEMRSLVCAQCHVEYYFDKKNGKDSYLTFPWKNGLTMENAEAYYDSVEHVDWVHTLSKAPMLKAQHPDFEMFTTGIHYSRGVACADCHMPYMSEGGVKYTNHQIMSPLNNIANSCQVCHRQSEEELLKNVYDRQKKVKELRDVLEKELVNAHYEAKAAWDAGATEDEMKLVLKLIRQSQWRWDFAVAGHGNAFHAPLETARLLGHGISKILEARVALSQILLKYNVKTPVEIPDISTKEKAQLAIGLDIPKLRSQKDEFLKIRVPKWLEEAAAREAKYGVKKI
jgi:nitrite reductase (cytochrome c-552)